MLVRILLGKLGIDEKGGLPSDLPKRAHRLQEIPIEDTAYTCEGDLYTSILNAPEEEQVEETGGKEEECTKAEEDEQNQIDAEKDAVEESAEDSSALWREQPPTGLDEIPLCSSIRDAEMEMRDALEQIQVHGNRCICIPDTKRRNEKF